MTKFNCPVIFALLVCCLVALCQSCGIPDLMKDGKEMQKKAEGVCKQQLTDAQKQALKACMDAEINNAQGREYHPYLEKALKKCFNDEMMNDPCSEKTKKEGEKCGKEFMDENKELKSKAMGWVTKYCKDFQSHMKTFGACSDKALNS